MRLPIWNLPYFRIRGGGGLEGVGGIEGITHLCIQRKCLCCRTIRGKGHKGREDFEGEDI